MFPKSRSKVNEAGNYTKPTMRKRLFQRIKSGGKGGAKKASKKIGARKLSVSNEKEVTFESFDTVEKRAEVAAQEQEDHKLAIKLQSDESGHAGSYLPVSLSWYTFGRPCTWPPDSPPYPDTGSNSLL